MSIFLFEYKVQLKNMMLWAASLVGVLLLFMLGIYPVFHNSIEDVLQVISGFPPEFAAAFNFDIAAMFDVGGFFSFAFAYISLVGAIMAVSIGVSAFSREKRSKCVDFILTKPVSREQVFLSKLQSCFLSLVSVNVVYIAVCYMVLSGEAVESGTIFLAALALFLTQLVFLSAGICLAVFLKKVRSVSGIATAIGFGAFILSALLNIMNEEKIRFIAPLKYFDPTELFKSGAFELPYAVMGAAVIIVTLCAAFVWFCKSDTHAV